MKKLGFLIMIVVAILSLGACSQNSSLSDDLNSTGDSIARFVNGTFAAQIDNTSVKSVYNAALLALNNSQVYTVKNNSINDQSAEITGSYATDKNFFNKSGTDDFSVRIVKNNDDIISVFIKIGKLGDKQASVNLLADIRSNLGL
jgi:hypothetical protein